MRWRKIIGTSWIESSLLASIKTGTELSKRQDASRRPGAVGSYSLCGQEKEGE
jgi:hypothetical protein